MQSYNKTLIMVEKDFLVCVGLYNVFGRPFFPVQWDEDLS